VTKATRAELQTQSNDHGSTATPRFSDVHHRRNNNLVQPQEWKLQKSKPSRRLSQLIPCIFDLLVARYSRANPLGRCLSVVSSICDVCNGSVGKSSVQIAFSDRRTTKIFTQRTEARNVGVSTSFQALQRCSHSESILLRLHTKTCWTSQLPRFFGGCE